MSSQTLLDSEPPAHLGACIIQLAAGVTTDVLLDADANLQHHKGRQHSPHM